VITFCVISSAHADRDRKLIKYYEILYYMGIVTRKYQITIPKEVRESLNIRVGDRVEIVRNERGEFVLKKVERNVDEYIRVLEDSAGALKMDKEKLKEIQEAIGESLHV